MCEGNLNLDTTHYS